MCIPAATRPSRRSAGSTSNSRTEFAGALLQLRCYHVWPTRHREGHARASPVLGALASHTRAQLRAQQRIARYAHLVAPVRLRFDGAHAARVRRCRSVTRSWRPASARGLLGLAIYDLAPELLTTLVSRRDAGGFARPQAARPAVGHLHRERRRARREPDAARLRLRVLRAVNAL